MEKIQKIDRLILDLETELSACEEHGFNFSASQIQGRIEKLEKMRDKLNAELLLKEKYK